MSVKAKIFLDLLEQSLEVERPQGGDYESRTLETTFPSQVKELIESQKLKLSDFSIRDLTKTFCRVDDEGRIVRPRRYHSRALSEGSRKELLEAGSPISSTAWPTVTSQLIFSEIRQPFENEKLVLSQRVRTIPSDIPGTEQIPSATNLGDVSTEVLEGREYDRVGVGEVTYTAPAKKKQGGIVEVTREMVRFDRTGLAVQQARRVGDINALKKEKGLADCFVGTTQNYIRQGTSYNTFNTGGAFVNNLSGLPLVDWTSIDQARQLFANMRDPETNEPLAIQGKHLIPMPSREWTAKHIAMATEVRSRTNPALGTRDEQRMGPNPVTGVEVFTSNLIRDRVLAGPQSVAAKADDGWFFGDLDEFLAWYENWGLEVEELGAGSDAAFYRDVEMAVKASYRGVAAVREPRYMARLENAAW